MIRQMTQSTLMAGLGATIATRTQTSSETANSVRNANHNRHRLSAQYTMMMMLFLTLIRAFTCGGIISYK